MASQCHVAAGGIHFNISAVADLAPRPLRKQPENVETITGHADLDVCSRIGIHRSLSPGQQLAVNDAVIQINATNAVTENETDAAAGLRCAGGLEIAPRRRISRASRLAIYRYGAL